MDNPSGRLAPAFRHRSPRTLYPHALWLRAGLVGMLAAAGGLASFAGNAGSSAQALGWLVAGVALTAYSWRRFRVAVAALETRIDATHRKPARGTFARDGSRAAAALQA